MNVCLLDLNAQHQPILNELREAVDQVILSNRFILGPEVTRLEERIAAYSGSRHGIGVTSGTDALLISLMALDIGPGDEVITSPYSFFATAGAVCRVGATPVFVDIDPVTFNIDPALIEGAVTRNTRAIIPVHLYGQSADMDPILACAERHGLAVIEDAAQAIGTEYKGGRRVGGMGTTGCFSFFPSKNLGCFGDGGMVTTNDPALAEKIEILRNHGSQPKYYHKFIGGNFRIDALQAAVLNVKLTHLDDWTRQRQENAAHYHELFHATGLVGEVIGLPSAVYAAPCVPHAHIYNQYVIRVPRRDELRACLNAATIGHDVYYPVPFHMQECFAYLGYRKGDFPQSEQAAAETVAIPVYSGMPAEHRQYVVDTIADFYGKRLGSVK